MFKLKLSIFGGIKQIYHKYIYAIKKVLKNFVVNSCGEFLL